MSSRARQWKRWCSGLALLLCSCGMAAAQSAPGPRSKALPEQLQQAIAKAQRGDVAGALSLADTLVQQQPDFEPAVKFQAALLEQIGDQPRADAAFARALTLAPNDPELLLKVSTARLRAGDAGGAVTLLQRLLRGNPRDSDALYYLAQAYHLKGDNELALKTIRACLQETPDDPAIWQKHGELLSSAGDNAEALRWLQKAEKADSTLERISYDLAVASYNNEDLEQARGYAAKAAEARPNDVKALALLGDVEVKLAQWPQAAAAFQQVLAVSSNDLPSLLGLGHCQVELKEFAAAAQTLESLLQRDPSQVLGHFYLARAYARLGRTQDAQREADLHRTMLEQAASPSPARVRASTTARVPTPQLAAPLKHEGVAPDERGLALTVQPPAGRLADLQNITFSDTLAQSKISFTLKSSITPQRYSIETMTGGVALFDYDNDGLLDIFFTNGASIPALEKSDATFFNRLFHNNGDGTFTDVTVKADVAGLGYSMGVAAGDYDNDGFVDLYVTGVNHNQLLHNNGNGTFTDVTAKAAVEGNVPGIGKAWGVTAGWFDYNNDGLLDLLVVNYLDYDIKTSSVCSVHKIATFCSPNDFHGVPNILYRNNGDGTFTDVSAASHVGQYVNKGMGVAFSDYDGDGYTDIFVSNDTYPNLLLHNNGDGTFTDEAANAGVAYNDMGKTVAGMGAEFRDLNNDGRPDIFHTAMFGDSFPLYENLGDGLFGDATSSAGLTAPTSRMTGWGVGAADFGNSGFKDLFSANAAILDNSMEVEHRPFRLPNSLYRNLGNLHFADVSALAGPSFSVAAAHRGAAFGDLNNDGLMDVVVTVLNGSPEILMNRTATHNHWILLKLVGTRDNRDGLGTRVKITTAEGTQYDQATTAVSYNSSSDKRVHFGLGPATMIDSIELKWPSGVQQTLTHVKADQVLTIRESAP